MGSCRDSTGCRVHNIGTAQVLSRCHFDGVVQGQCSDSYSVGLSDWSKSRRGALDITGVFLSSHLAGKHVQKRCPLCQSTCLHGSYQPSTLKGSPQCNGAPRTDVFSDIDIPLSLKMPFVPGRCKA